MIEENRPPGRSSETWHEALQMQGDDCYRRRSSSLFWYWVIPGVRRPDLLLPLFMCHPFHPLVTSTQSRQGTPLRTVIEPFPLAPFYTFFFSFLLSFYLCTSDSFLHIALLISHFSFTVVPLANCILYQATTEKNMLRELSYYKKFVPHKRTLLPFI